MCAIQHDEFVADKVKAQGQRFHGRDGLKFARLRIKSMDAAGNPVGEPDTAVCPSNGLKES